MTHSEDACRIVEETIPLIGVHFFTYKQLFFKFRNKNTPFVGEDERIS